MVRLTGFGPRRIWEMSGGQQQRVALALAIVNKPKILLLDEPMAALDKKLRHDMQIELKSLQRELGITFVLVTHDQEEALSMSDRICIMGQGRIVQTGTPEDLYDRPQSRYVADFVGRSNFIEAVAGMTFRARGGEGIALPQIAPAVLAGFLLAFTFSFDDFIIAFFVAGSETTLPIHVFSSIRRGVTPEINAIGTMVLLASLFLLITAQVILRRRARQTPAGE